jgi:amino acid adenylation domain-containing protein
MSDLSARLPELPPEQLDRLVRRLMEKGGPVRPAGIPRRAGQERAPLSAAQRRLWLLARLDPESPAYHIAGAVALHGALRVDSLESALARVVQRHEALRTTFVETAGEPEQAVAPSASVPLPRIDLTALDPAAREREAARLAVEIARIPFALERGPLLRTALLALAPDEHRLLLVFHHLIADGASLHVLVSEVARLYGGEPLPALPVQYADYAVWHRGWLEGVLEREVAFWRERLAGLPPALDLPADHPRPERPSGKGGKVWRALPGGSGSGIDGIDALAHGAGATRFMALLAAVWALLHRYTGEDDLPVGTPSAGRIRPELEGLIGCFVNTLVLRGDTSGDPAFGALLARARETVLDAEANADVPFDRLVEALQPEREPGRNPLFQVMIAPGEGEVEASLPGLALRLLDVDAGTAQLDLTFLAGESGGVLRIGVEHAADLYDAATAERMLGHLEALLTAAIGGAAERRLSDLPLLTEAELRQAIAEAPAAAPAAEDPDELLRQAAERFAGRPALAFGDQRSWTHAELADRVEELARRLRGHGVGPEVRVALRLERSPEAIVALLAVLRAGGAWVALDPAHPAERLRGLIEDAGAALVLTGAGDLDGPLEEAPAREQAPGPDALAYVLYTSGSTGTPKGVEVSRGALAAHLRATIAAYELEPEDRALQLASLAFDVALEEVLPTLAAGGCVVVPPGSAAEALAGLTERIRRERITVLNLPAGAWSEWVGEMRRAGEALPESLRLVITGSEPVPAARLADWWALRTPEGRGVPLLSAYGLTEATITSTLYRAAPELRVRGASLPIGRPLPGVRALLLDRSGRPAPAGLPGELALGGAGLARGYHGRPDLTAERFVPNPFGPPGARLYRTGDLARWLPEGDLEFLGRADRQLKVRGVRIEPGEVEAALLAHPGVREAAVGSADGRLVAWVTGDLPSTAELRDFVAERLPAALVPSAFVALDRLPRTASGKLDRRALPAPAAAPAEPAALAPRSLEEEVVADVWAETLGMEAGGIGLDASFFDLGGHSLLATTVIARLRQRLGVEVPLRDLFEAPTVSGLAARIAEARRRRDGVALPPPRLIPREERAGDLPTSYSQNHLWLADQLEPGALHTLPALVRVTGRLDPEALRRSLDEVVRRHEDLRTTFPSVGGQPVQRIAPRSPRSEVALPRIDLSALADARAEARRLALAEVERPFDLAAGPLLRAALLRLGADEHLLLLNLHHIVADGWSLGLLLEEIAALYPAVAIGAPSPLPELPLQYADYAVWQREALQGEALAALLAFWRSRLEGSSMLLDLPTDRPRPAVLGHRGARVEEELPDDLAAGLARLAREQGATLFMVLLTGYARVLSAWSGQRDFNVGTFVANRTRAEFHRLIGFFANNLPLRVDLSEGPTFATALARARETTLGAFAHQELPFERLLEELQPPRTPRHAPVFQVVLVLQNTPAPPLAIPGLRLEIEPLPRDRADFDLTLWVEPAGGLGRPRLSAGLEHNTDLFDAASARRMLRQLRVLLAAAVADPSRPLADLPLLDPEEERQVTVDFAHAGPAHPWHGGAHRLFREQVEAVPDRIAIEESQGARRSWIYAELGDRVDRIAAHLRGAHRVVVLFDRSPEQIAAIFAALEAGAAFVPLDASLPPGRLAEILDDIHADVIVTDESVGRRIPERFGPRLSLDAGWEEALGPAPALPRVEVSPSHLAYVIYTSGSTGRPKGVAMGHGALDAFTSETRASYEIVPGDRVLQFFSIGSDPSIEEIFPCLTGGATLVLRDDRMAGSADVFLRRCGELGVTYLNLPTAFWRELAAAVGSGARVPDCVRLVVIGGEAATAASARAWLRGIEPMRPGCRLVNTYGPAETCPVSTRTTLRDDPWHEPPIGRPLDGTRAYVLSGALRPLPVGAVGEICLAGAFVGSGYFGDPALTAERFVPDPWSAPGDTGGARMYRTGDLGRFLPDGMLDFRGRVDHQVKIRGYRVEPAEVEAVLGRHPGLQECAVVPRKDAGILRLVAYVVPAEGERTPPLGELRALVRSVLPDYMVPSQWVVLEKLPRTPFGKLDRASLPAPAGRRDDVAGMDGGYVAPRDAVEELVADIWGDLLGLDRVGVEDDFFELGGHSLIATQAIARIREAFGVELPLAGLFEAPTVADLAESIRGADGPSLPPVVRVPRDRPLPLSFSQERLWFLARLQPDDPSYHVPRAIRISGPFDPAALEAAFSALIARHEVMRTVFPAIDGRPAQVVRPASRFVLPIVDLTVLPEGTRERELRDLVLLQGRRRFDLEHGPLLRAMLLRLGPDDHCLNQAEHHLVHDGWAEGVLVRDLLAFYQAARDGRPADLPALPIQYADFAAWQRQWMTGEVLDAQLSYWVEHLRGAPALLELPTDRPRPPVRRAEGALLTVPLRDGLSATVRDLGRRERATLFMSLFAVFETLLLRYTGQSDLVTGSAFANRRLQESEGLLGMIINTVAMRVDVSGDPPFRDLLARVRKVCLGAYAHQDLPFDKVVEALRPERSPSYTPVFQNLFAFHDVPEPALELPGLRLDAIDSHNRTAKFDMNLLIAPFAQGVEGEDVALTALLEYDAALFDRSTMERLIVHFERLAAAAAERPDLRVSELPLLSDAEALQLVTRWTDTALPYPSERGLHEIVAELAAERPSALALSFPDADLTRAELERRANALAARLAGAGVRPGDRVGLFLERSAALVAGLLAILKTGAAYVPLDPGYPAERLALLAEDSGVALVVSREGLEARLPRGVRTVRTSDAESDGGDGGPGVDGAGFVPYRGGGDLPAYLMYTSGSTGRPKGVVVPHRGAVRLVVGTDYVRFGPSDRVAQVNSPSFDATTFEIWGALLHGACLVGLPQEVVLSPVAFAASLHEREITHLLLTTALLNAIAAVVPDAFAGLDTLLFGGEAVTPERVRAVLQAGPPKNLLHIYGPTENSTFSSWHRVERVEEGAVTVPIGRANSNSTLYVLDPALRPAPAGIPGELFAGGDGLALGYWRRPDLTAERFLPDPFDGRPGARMYRTGDRVRLRDGSVEFLGRFDEQVKFRGYRIEPGEIEAEIARHPAVRQALVLVREEERGERRLVAWTVLRPGEPAPDLRAWLRGRLPAHMVPSAYVPLDAFPLTANGKVDRRALPAPPADLPSAAAYVAPSTPTEQAVAAIWAEVLGAPRVGLNDNFFDLGGHSLVATQVVLRIESEFGVQLPLRSLFDTPTVGEVSRWIEQRQLETAGEDRLADLLAEMDGLSDEEVQALLAGQDGEEVPLV